MSLKLFFCRLGFHKWTRLKSIKIDDFLFIKRRICIKCEKLQRQNIFGGIWRDMIDKNEY